MRSFVEWSMSKTIFFTDNVKKEYRFMKKNTLFFTGMLAMLTFGLVLTGCSMMDGTAGTPRELTAVVSPAVTAVYTATTASVTFSVATGLLGSGSGNGFDGDITGSDFKVSGGATIDNHVSVEGDIATVTVKFEQNGTTLNKFYDVSVASSSMLIAGNGTVRITHTPKS
jgi:hypothetical protein